LYTYAPYRFIETYVRGDIGENLAFAFIPLVLFFIYKLYKRNDYRYFLPAGFSLSFLILAHNAISIMFIPFILIYGLFLLYLSKERKSYLIKLIFLFTLGFLLSAFFWLPALIEGKYTLRDIVTKGGYLNNFVSFKNLIYGDWNYGGSGQFSVQLGLFQWIAILLSPILIYFQKKKGDKNYWFSALLLIYTFSAIFLMLSVSNIVWSKILLLQNFQFPWRFLAITVFSTAVLGALAIDNLFNKTKIFAVTFSILIIIFISSFYWFPRGYIYKPESFFTGIYNSTTDTGESSPIWSVRFMEKRPKKYLNVIDGSAKITNLQRTSTYHKYIINVLKPTLFEENTLYFPGWEIKANGKPLNIQFQNRDYRGIMLFSLNKGSYVIEAEYKETKLRAIADALSVVVLFNILGFLGFRFVRRHLS